MLGASGSTSVVRVGVSVRVRVRVRWLAHARRLRFDLGG